jgi:hypothetical protein
MITLSILLLAVAAGNSCVEVGSEPTRLNDEQRSALRAAIFGDVRAIRRFNNSLDGSLCVESGPEWQTAIGLMTADAFGDEGLMLRQIADYYLREVSVDPLPLGLGLAVFAANRGDCRANVTAAEFIDRVFGSDDGTLKDWLEHKNSQGDANARVALLLLQSRFGEDAGVARGAAAEMASILKASTFLPREARMFAELDLYLAKFELEDGDIANVYRSKIRCPLDAHLLRRINELTGFTFESLQ